MSRSPTFSPRQRADDTRPYNVPRPPHAQPVRRTPPRRRPNWGRRLKITALVLLIVFVAAIALLWQRAAAFNDAVSTESAMSMRLFGPFAEERVNVLLLGYSDESRDGAHLSDSMNLLSIDRTTATTTMIGIPRDLWVEGMPQVPDNMKINEALRIGYYADGIANGGELAAEAVTYVTGLRVHGWIALDFEGFAAMVDAIGGVTVENPTAFAYTWHEGNFLAGHFQHSFDAGTLELSGEEALDYSRSRYTSVAEESSDFARSVRQQRVLQAIRANVGGWRTIPNGLAIAEALQGHLHTNLAVLDLAMLAGKLSVDRRIELSEDVILEATRNTLGQYVLVVIGRSTPDDYAPLHRYIDQEVAAPLPTASPSPNGGGR